MAEKIKMEQVFARLLSADDEQVLGALAEVEQRGDARAIRPLLHALAGARQERVRQRIIAMLHQVKVKDAVPELIAALEEPDLAGVRTTILATFWNAGLDMHDHLDTLISTAIEGDAAECFECLTVVENQELFPERAVRTAVVRVRHAAAAEPDTYKAAMLGDLLRGLEGRLGR